MENPFSEEQIRQLNEISKLPSEKQQVKLQSLLSTFNEDQIKFLQEQQSAGGQEGGQCPFCLIIEDDFVSAIEVPELPAAKYARLQEQYWIKEDDAFILWSDKSLCDYFEETVELSGDAKKTSNWILSELMKFTKEDLIWVRDSKVTPQHIATIVKTINSGDISWKIAKDIFPEIYKDWTSPEVIIERDWLKQNSNTEELEAICQKVLDNNPGIVETFKSWKDKAFWALVGMTMKETKGQANPQMVNEILKKLI